MKKSFFSSFVEKLILLRNKLRSDVKLFALVVFSLSFVTYTFRVALYWWATGGVVFDPTFFLLTFFCATGVIIPTLMHWIVWKTKPSDSRLRNYINSNIINLDRISKNKDLWSSFEDHVKVKYNLHNCFKVRAWGPIFLWTLGFAIILKEFFGLGELVLPLFYVSFLGMAYFVLNLIVVEYYLIREPIPSHISFALPKPVEDIFIVFMRRAASGCADTAFEGSKRFSNFCYKNGKSIRSGLVLVGSVGALAFEADRAYAMHTGETSYLSRAGTLSRYGWQTKNPEIATFANSLEFEGVPAKSLCIEGTNELDPSLVRKRYFQMVKDSIDSAS